MVDKETQSCMEITARANALFLSSFEKWVEASITCNEHGGTPKERIERIQTSYTNAIKSNVEYHTLMGRTEEDNGDKDSAALHRAMAQAYAAMLA
jgi:hypothetical protein